MRNPEARAKLAARAVTGAHGGQGTHGTRVLERRRRGRALDPRARGDLARAVQRARDGAPHRPRSGHQRDAGCRARNCSTNRWASTPTRNDAQRAARTNPSPSSASLHGGHSHHAPWATTSSVSSPGNASRQRPQRRGGGGRSLGAASAVTGVAGAAISARPANVTRRERRRQHGSVRGAAQPVAGRVRVRDLEPTAPGPQEAAADVDTGPDDEGLVVAARVPAARTGAARRSSAARRRRRSRSTSRSAGAACRTARTRTYRDLQAWDSQGSSTRLRLHTCNSFLETKG